MKISFEVKLLSIRILLIRYHYDYEMQWVDEARLKYTGKVQLTPERKPSSSISTTDENLSMLEYNDSEKLEDDDFMFGSDDDNDHRRALEE